MVGFTKSLISISLVGVLLSAFIDMWMEIDVLDERVLLLEQTDEDDK